MGGSVAGNQGHVFGNGASTLPLKDFTKVNTKSQDTDTASTSALTDVSAVTKAVSDIAKDTSKKSGVGFKFALGVAAVMIAGSSPVGAVMIVALLAANELARDSSNTSDDASDSSAEQFNNATGVSAPSSSVEDPNKKRREEEEQRKRSSAFNDDQNLSGFEPKFGWKDFGSVAK